MVTITEMWSKLRSDLSSDLYLLKPAEFTPYGIYVINGQSGREVIKCAQYGAI